MNEKYTKFTFENEFSDFFDVADLDGLATTKSKGGQEQYDQGFREGLAQGRAEGENANAEEIAALKQQLEALTRKLTEQTTAWQAQLSREALTLMRTSLHKLAGEAAKHYSDQLLEHHLKHLLGLLHQGDNLTLRINPQAKAYHEKLGLPHANIGGIPFKIESDPALGITDVVMEWPSGGLESKLSASLANLDKLLAEGGADITQPAPALPAESDLKVQEPPSPLAEVEQQTKTRADELLGDDELVDALK